MHGSLSDDIICSKMRTVFPRTKSEENYELREQVMSKDKYTDIFSRQIEAIAFIILKIFCNVREKCLRTAYCLLRGTFSFEFSGTTLWTKNISLLLDNTIKRFSYLELHLKRRLIDADVGLKN